MPSFGYAPEVVQFIWASCLKLTTYLNLRVLFIPPCLAIHETLEKINKENQEKLGLPEIKEIPKLIWVKERYNKFGEITKEHYHLNWELIETGIKIKKDTIQKILNRKYHLKGNKMYCLRVHDAFFFIMFRT